MAFYDLVTNGNADFYARRVGAKKVLRREPLSGILDGTNLVFMSPRFPVLDDTSLRVYEGATLVTPPTYSVEADTGVFTWYAAPTVQPTADMTVVPLTSAQVTLFAWAGFHLLEQLWFRGLVLSNSNTAYAMATQTDTHIYVAQGPVNTGAALVDPVCGALTFSTSSLQRQVLGLCTELAYLDCMLYESSMSDVDFAERVGGARIGASRRPQNIKTARDQAYKQVVDAIYAAMAESDDSLQFLGRGVLPPHTTEYDQVWNWQATGGIGLGVGYIPNSINWPVT